MCFQCKGGNTIGPFAEKQMLRFAFQDKATGAKFASIVTWQQGVSNFILITL